MHWAHLAVHYGDIFLRSSLPKNWLIQFAGTVQFSTCATTILYIYTFGFLGSGVWPGPLDYESNSFI